MALIYCPDCGHQVSNAAAACVGCGYPITVYRPPVDPLASQKTMAHVCYGLLVAMNGATWIPALILAYVKRNEVRGTWLESHFEWQINTFWWPVVWGAAMLFCFLLVGAGAGAAGAEIAMILLMFGMFGVFGGTIYRIIKGWMRLADGKPVY